VRLALQWLLEQPGVISREEQTPLSTEEGWPLLHDGWPKALAELCGRREAEGAALDKELRASSPPWRARWRGPPHAVPSPSSASSSAFASESRGSWPARRSTKAPGHRGRQWAEKSDVTEELARLRSHMGEFARLLDEGGAVGRTLDFLIQEMNREVNTVGSKAE